MANKLLMNILTLKKHSVVDENTGESKSGCTVYIGQETEDFSGNTLGWDVMKLSAPLSVCLPF